MTQHDILTTRPLTPGDFEAWFPLWGQYLAQNKTRMRWTDRTALFRNLARRLDQAAAMVVECDGALVGFAHYHIHSARFAFENAYYLQDIFVLPDFQQKRAGTCLMQAVYREAHQNGAPAVYWKAAEMTCRGDAAAAPASSFLQFRKAA